MAVDCDDDAPIRYLIGEMEAFILRMAAEIDRLRTRVQELESAAKPEQYQTDKGDRELSG